MLASPNTVLKVRHATTCLIFRFQIVNVFENIESDVWRAKREHDMDMDMDMDQLD